MAGITLSASLIERYFLLLRNLDATSKKRLVKKLEDSMASDTGASGNPMALFGAWKDDRDSDTIISEIREARSINPDREKF